jgi:hypothetical protein
VVGLDAAYSSIGGDRTVLVELSFGPAADGQIIIAPKPPIVVPVRDIRADPPEDQIARYCREYCERRNVTPDNFGFDGTGRSSLTSALGRVWSPGVVAIEFGGTASERTLGPIQKCKERFDRFVTELWFAIRHIIEHGQFRGMTEAYLEEGQAREWVEKNKGVVSVLRKDQVKDALGRSPDLFDALACAVEMARRRGFEMKKANSRAMTTIPEWIRKKMDKAKALVRSHELSFDA